MAMRMIEEYGILNEKKCRQKKKELAGIQNFQTIGKNLALYK